MIQQVLYICKIYEAEIQNIFAQAGSVTAIPPPLTRHLPLHKGGGVNAKKPCRYPAGLNFICGVSF